MVSAVRSVILRVSGIGGIVRGVVLFACLSSIALACTSRDRPGPPASDGGAGGGDSGSVPDHCGNGRRDGDEPHLDCGGSCDPCADGLGCLLGTDCQSQVCRSGYCLVPACTDGVENGRELGPDCGGACPGCPGGSTCRDGTDCLSGVCDMGTCTDTSCMDGLMNASETGTDCGGPLCAGCPGGDACEMDRDCESLICQVGGVCAEASCSDLVANAGESDVDCGGPRCGPCGAGASCGIPSDCSSRICRDARCTMASCTDRVANQDETDVDCGGMMCPDRCAPDGACRAATDCDSRVCSMETCRAPSCTDGIQNAGESDVDCGGPTMCARCPDYRTCAAAADCEADTCTMGYCGDTGCVPFPGTPTDTFGYFGCTLPLTPSTLPCPDVRTTGTIASLSDDSHVTVPIGFTFDFYGVARTNVAIQSNGVLSFASSTISFSNSCLPYASTPNELIAVFWDDLYPPEVRYQTLGTAPNRQFVVTWDLQHFSSSPSHGVFTAVLEETTNDIQVCYVDTNFGSASYDRGATATTGIQNATSSLQYSCNTTTVNDGLLIRYLHP